MIVRVMTNDNKMRKGRGMESQAGTGWHARLPVQPGGRALCPHGRPLSRAVNTETTAGAYTHTVAYAE